MTAQAKPNAGRCEAKDDMGLRCVKVQGHDSNPDVPEAMHKAFLPDGRRYSWVTPKPGGGT